LLSKIIMDSDLRDDDLVGLSSVGLALYPFGLVVCFTTAWFYNKKYYYQELAKIGYVERLMSIEHNLKDFKEVIRKEVCEQIVKGMTLIFNQPDVFHQDPNMDEHYSSMENMKKNNILKVKDAVINLVKKTRDKFTMADVKNINIRNRVDLVDNMHIRRESRTKRSFYTGDDQNS